MSEEKSAKKFYTPREAAEKIGIHYHTLLTYIKDGRIEALRLPSGYYRLTDEGINKFVNSLKINTKKTSQRTRH